jgi:iron complex outermembrane receptor protein
VAPNLEGVPTSYFVNSENTARTEAYALFNIRLGYTYRPWNVSTFLEARNLADKQYIAAVTVDDANGRFSAPGDAGDGRGFYCGISWRWR